MNKISDFMRKVHSKWKDWILVGIILTSVFFIAVSLFRDKEKIVSTTLQYTQTEQELKVKRLPFVKRKTVYKAWLSFVKGQIICGWLWISAKPLRRR